MPAQRSKKPRILIVEDNSSHAILLQRWLNRYDLTIARNGVLGDQLARDERWDLILSDVMLPGRNGVDLIRRAKRVRPTTPALLITGESDVQIAIRAIDNGVDGYLIKPLDRDVLLAKVEALIQQGQSTRRSRRTVLAIGAHPNDVEVGCGGILLQHRERGDHIMILTLTRGEGPHNPIRRRVEAFQSAGRLGADLRITEMAPNRIPDGGETIRLIQQVVGQVDPDVIYTHSQHDSHTDHRAVHRATLTASYNVQEVYCYRSPSTTIDFHPHRFVNIEDHMEEKISLIGLYQAPEGTDEPHLDPGLIRATAIYWGQYANYRAVEPLEIQRASS